MCYAESDGLKRRLREKLLADEQYHSRTTKLGCAIERQGGRHLYPCGRLFRPTAIDESYAQSQSEMHRCTDVPNHADEVTPRMQCPEFILRNVRSDAERRQQLTDIRSDHLSAHKSLPDSEKVRKNVNDGESY